MNITLTLQADTAPELLTAIHSLAGVIDNKVYTLPPKAAQAMPLATETAKTEKKPIKKSTENTTTGEPKDVTLEQARAAAASLKDAGRMDDVKAVLGELGVTRVVDLEKSQYATFVEKLNAL